jgi:hypothetical protein
VVSRVRKPPLGFGISCQDASDERESEGRGNDALKTRSIEVLMFSLCLIALGCGSETSSSPHVASSSTGPNVGQKMPPFTALDQFGQTISSETLKGTNGTVLLFFRSADW